MTQMPLTDRAFDERDKTGQRAYIHASTFIGVARDNQKALEEMLQSGSPIRPHAPWNLIRPAFEAAFYPVWMLSPDTREERLRRALRVAWSEQKSHTARFDLKVKLAKADDHEEVAKARARDGQIRQRYIEEATSLGMTKDQMGQKIVVTNELPKLTSVFDRFPDEATFHLLRWRELSGVMHGDMGATLGLTDKAYRLDIPGGSTAVVSLNDDAFVTACYASALMQLTAMNLYIQRSTTSHR
ncbi:hypothetical protein [Luteococcus peritonei]|uniref:Uncharacterized protein n=1 Tax=Luteococcus peritonei TaxID=88874 RepID=A0ABW4RVR5_9ACTN